MNKRTAPNLLDEARNLTDDDYAYGAFILARALGREMAAGGGEPAATPLQKRLRVRATAGEFGLLLNEIYPGRQLAARRIVVTQDAAELAFADA